MLFSRACQGTARARHWFHHMPGGCNVCQPQQLFRSLQDFAGLAELAGLYKGFE